MRIIHVLRKPLSEGTVASNTLKHGVGGLNIDASRIGTTDSLGGGRLAGPTRMDQTCGGNEWDRPWMTDPSLRESYAKATAEKVAKAENLGRWPSNLILQHLDGCRCDGVKRVKASAAASGPSLTGKSTSNSRGVFNGVESTPCYSGEDGKESVDNWICAEGCPVARLDEQSGITPGDKRAFTGGKVEKGLEGKKEDIYTAGWRARTDIKGTCYAEGGGASRFFQQVGGGSDSPSKG